MKIWKKILTGFISVILIMMIVDVIALRNNIDIINKIHDLEISKRVELTQSNKIAYLLQQINSNLQGIFLEQEYPEVQSRLVQARIIVDESIPRMNGAIHELSNATRIELDFAKDKDDIAEDKNKLSEDDSLAHMAGIFVSSVKNVLKMQDENRYKEAENLYENETEIISDRIRKLTELTVSQAEADIQRALMQLDKEVEEAIHTGIRLTLFSIILALAIGFYISRSISDPLNRIIAGTDQIRKGNLEVNVELNTKGELQSLADSFNNMAGELKKQISSIDKMNKDLLESNQSKDAFFSIIAHDLKNPFGIILGLAELLKSQYNDLQERERKEFIDEINNSTKQIYELLENLLMWARSQSGKIQIVKENLNLKHITEKSIVSYAANARQKNITILNRIGEEVNVFVDGHTIQVVINNILNNAIKFTPEGGSVVFSAEQASDFVKISIRDTGVGMTKETIDRLAKEGALPTKPGTNNETGTGLGLILIREFVSKNGGQLHIESKPGDGTDFCFTLPKT